MIRAGWSWQRIGKVMKRVSDEDTIQTSYQYYMSLK